MSYRFLVADDMEINRKLMWSLLMHQGEVDFANDGLQTVQAWKKALAEGKPYDLILLDIMMPEMDGQQALAEIRHQEAALGFDSGQEVKVAMVTCLGDYDNALEGFKNGVADYLVKPVDKSKIEHLLHDLNLL